MATNRLVPSLGARWRFTWMQLPASSHWRSNASRFNAALEPPVCCRRPPPPPPEPPLFCPPPPPPPPSSVTGPANSVSPCTNATRSTSPVASPSSVTATTGQRMWSTDSTPPYRPKTHHLANTCKSRLRRSPLPYIEVDHWQRQTDCSESGRRSRSSRPVALVQCDAWHRGCHASGPKAKRGSTPKC